MSKGICDPIIVLLLTAFMAIPSLTLIRVAKASPTITAFYNNLAGFNTAAGSPPIKVDFDSITPNTDITGFTLQGVTFDFGNQPAPSAPLIVVRAVDTYSAPGFTWSEPDNKLFATSGENVLSPGGVELAPGPNPLKENDDLKLTLSTPVVAIGFDILYQSLDGASLTAITLFDAADSVLYFGDPIPIPGGYPAPGGSTFVGFVSDSSNIAKIIINEYDGNNANPDSNIGFDTIRLAPNLPYPPVASFNWKPTTPDASEPVLFNASASQPGFDGYDECPITEYRWNFGDGNMTTVSIPTVYHSFSSAGTYHVNLTVYALGATPETDTTSHNMTVVSVPVAPVGGYSVSAKGNMNTAPLASYLTLVATAAASFTIVKRKTARKATVKRVR